MKKNTVLLHIIQSLDNGGCENMLLRTLPLLGDFEHKIITLNRSGELAEKFKNENISIVNIGQKNLFDIYSYFKLLKEVKKNRPDIIITYLFHADAIGRLFLQALTNIKIIPFLRTTYNHEKYWAARLFEKATKYFVKNYLANSESVKSFYAEEIGVPKEKITVIPNGIDTEFFDSIPRNENLRKELGISTGGTAIICVANFHINKGHKYLLEAFEELYHNNHFIKLLLVGDGDEKENLLKQTEKYESKNNILFLGGRSDVPVLLKSSDIFVLPTLFEGMSNAIMEAMAAGLPIITTNINENLELIEDKKSGLLCDIRNSSSIKNNLSLLIENKGFRRILGNNAISTIKENYEIKKIAKELANLI